MKTFKQFFTITMVIFLFTVGYSQTTDKTPYIEITGAGDTTLKPDEFYITIGLKDNNKTPIEAQEENLKSKLKEIGIDLKNLTILDMFEEYSRSSWFDKSVQAEKYFLLKVTNAEILKAVFTGLKSLDVDVVYISKISNSKIETLRKEVRIKAIKNAKQKGEYMLAVLNQQLGKPLEIIEMDIKESDVADYYSRPRGARNVNYFMGPTYETIEFDDIKLNYRILIKFEIK